MARAQPAGDARDTPLQERYRRGRAGRPGHQARPVASRPAAVSRQRRGGGRSRPSRLMIVTKSSPTVSSVWSTPSTSCCVVRSIAGRCGVATCSGGAGGAIAGSGEIAGGGGGAGGTAGPRGGGATRRGGCGGAGGGILRVLAAVARRGGARRAAARRGAGAIGATSVPRAPGSPASAGEISGPTRTWRSEPSPPKPPAPTSTTTSAATMAAGTIAAAVPARSSWRSHAPTRSMRR